MLLVLELYCGRVHNSWLARLENVLEERLSLLAATSIMLENIQFSSILDLIASRIGLDFPVGA